jgi:hypothetical protein
LRRTLITRSCFVGGLARRQAFAWGGAALREAGRVKLGGSDAAIRTTDKPL